MSCVAISTNSVIGNFSEAVASHFVNAEIKLFSYQELEQAKDWIISRG
ncbi:MAG: STAS/SEC14 domain-containing protein [Proteobacteria bacterium]|nr:STAS/SEC14 domain-containing protein [Pseudomonadota bacterium]